MPIQIDRSKAHDLAPRWDEALERVRNEFEGLDPHRQYRNAFARLLKPDPLGRVPMMGTDQRDLFVPALRRVIEAGVPTNVTFSTSGGRWPPVTSEKAMNFLTRNEHLLVM
jgi:hypothetical protein